MRSYFPTICGNAFPLSMVDVNVEVSELVQIGVGPEHRRTLTTPLDPVSERRWTLITLLDPSPGVSALLYIGAPLSIRWSRIQAFSICWRSPLSHRRHTSNISYGAILIRSIPHPSGISSLLQRHTTHLFPFVQFCNHTPISFIPTVVKKNCRP